jgi:hypothetical protein
METKLKTKIMTRIPMQLIIAILSLNFFSFQSAFGAIPSEKTVLARMARNGGKGTYSIDQEIQFRSMAEPLVLREHWVVSDGESLRLIVTSPKSATDPIYFENTYRDGKRVALDAQGVNHSTPISSEFFEPFSHLRSRRGILDVLTHSRIFNANSRTSLDEHVRLGRSNGVITWIYGDATPIDAKKLNPMIWIEQDMFTLRRLRFPTQAEVSFDNILSFPNGLKLARDRTVTWDNNTVTIRVLAAKPTAESIAASAVSKAGALKSTKLPEAGLVKEFYSRFR